MVAAPAGTGIRRLQKPSVCCLLLETYSHRLLHCAIHSRSRDPAAIWRKLSVLAFEC